MNLPCELVGLHGDKETKVYREDDFISCLTWKVLHAEVPRPSKKSFEY